MTNWRQAETLKFISLVKQNPCLYNVRTLDYLDRAKKAKVFREILNEMKSSIDGLNVEKIKAKWKNLRSQYVRELRAVNHSMKSGSAKYGRYIPKLWCFQQLSFLGSHVKQRTSEDYLEAAANKSPSISESPQIKVDIESETCDASCSSAQTPTEIDQNVNILREREEESQYIFSRDMDCFQGPISSHFQRRKYSWLGELVTAQMDDISPDQQADAAWQVQCLMRRLVSEGTNHDLKFGIFHTR